MSETKVEDRVDQLLRESHTLRKQAEELSKQNQEKMGEVMRLIRLASMEALANLDTGRLRLSVPVVETLIAQADLPQMTHMTSELVRERYPSLESLPDREMQDLGVIHVFEIQGEKPDREVTLWQISLDVWTEMFELGKRLMMEKAIRQEQQLPNPTTKTPPGLH